MINCPNCAHNNPDGAVNCEACFTPLPIVKTIQCPSCNATVLSDAKFCGHCGFNLSASPEISPILSIPNAMSNTVSNSRPDQTTEGNVIPNLVASSISESPIILNEIETQPETAPHNISEPNNIEPNNIENIPIVESLNLKTQLQQFSASLLHLQTNLTIEIPAHLPVVHIGKPNTIIPPDIDVSGFSDSDVVSRIHADIRAEGGAFYFEDTGSSNGTYINNLPLPVGNRHKLRAGDRISLGKGDKVSFIFQLNS